MFVPNFIILCQAVLEKSLTEKSSHTHLQKRQKLYTYKLRICRGYNDTEIEKVEKVQRTAARWVFKRWHNISFFPPRLSGTGMTSLSLCFLLLKCQMIVCPCSLHSCVLGTNFFPIRTPGEIMSFGVSPVNYSGSDSVASMTCLMNLGGHSWRTAGSLTFFYKIHSGTVPLDKYPGPRLKYTRAFHDS